MLFMHSPSGIEKNAVQTCILWWCLKLFERRKKRMHYAWMQFLSIHCNTCAPRYVHLLWSPPLLIWTGMLLSHLMNGILESLSAEMVQRWICTTQNSQTHYWKWTHNRIWNWNNFSSAEMMVLCYLLGWAIGNVVEYWVTVSTVYVYILRLKSLATPR